MLERHGVKHVFGLPGGAAIPLGDGLAGSKLRLVQTRACGEPAVVVVTSGPGPGAFLVLRPR